MFLRLENPDMFHKSTGRLHYKGSDSLVLIVDQNISDYYRSLIPPWHNVNRPRYGAHVTIVRTGKEVPKNTATWRKYHGEKVLFYYEPYIHYGTIYYWLNVFCNRLEDIRVELGLPITSPYKSPPEGFKKYFHVTIANVKPD